MPETPRSTVLNPTDYPVGTRLEVTCKIEYIPPGITSGPPIFWFEIMEWGNYFGIGRPGNKVKVRYDDNEGKYTEGVWLHPSNYIPVSVIPVKEDGGRMVSVPPCVLNPIYHPKGTRVKGDYSLNQTRLDFTVDNWFPAGNSKDDGYVIVIPTGEKKRSYNDLF